MLINLFSYLRLIMNNVRILVFFRDFIYDIGFMDIIDHFQTVCGPYLFYKHFEIQLMSKDTSL